MLVQSVYYTYLYIYNYIGSKIIVFFSLTVCSLVLAKLDQLPRGQKRKRAFQVMFGKQG